MQLTHLLPLLLLLPLSTTSLAQRQETYLLNDWKFSHTDAPNQSQPSFNDSRWQNVTVPHDWAITGPFDANIDKQVVAIEQNGEKTATEKTGRTGSLPWIGTGWYRRSFAVPTHCQRALLNFDGAMSEPEVYVNGQHVGGWKYGYTPFILDITPYVHTDGTPNLLAVRLQNIPKSSRWYPGAGLYRPVRLITTNREAIKEWGLNVTTLSIDTLTHTAQIKVDVETTADTGATIELHSNDFTLPSHLRSIPVQSGQGSQLFTLPILTPSSEDKGEGLDLWTPETPHLYHLTVLLKRNEQILDTRTIKFGIRTVSVSAQNGFQLNGKTRKIKGVCLHHDLGMIGSAINKAALAHQLHLLKDMGADAIRTSHNHPSQWQMELCDSLGLMVMAESFDMWIYPKVKNGYNRFYTEWMQKDLTNLVLSNRLHPSIVMWSIGNEVPEQGSKEGPLMARNMLELLQRLDPSRPVTAGMDRVTRALASGFAQVLDIPGLNYNLGNYSKAYDQLRHGFLLGSETASTVSSRGIYKFPVQEYKGHAHPDGQCSSYDVEACPWSNLPDDDWKWQDDEPWVIGEFVWTGFDYLGEPTPYDEYAPARSSYFGIFDLAGLPKDRFWLYRSHWNTQQPTIHLLPHWNWAGREGQITPVYCYTNYPTAELFLNGKSQGRITKNPDSRLDRYRLRWNQVRYEAGELRVVVYDQQGNPQGEQTIRTAGTPTRLSAQADRTTLHADGADMAFITVQALDRDSNPSPLADNLIKVQVRGAANFKGICNGDPTSSETFVQPQMHLFNGQLVIGIITTRQAGRIQVHISGKGLQSTSIQLQSTL